MITQRSINDLSFKLIGLAIEVHRELGPGLIESIYEKCYKHLIINAGLKLDTQVRVPVHFKGEFMDCNLRLDLIVEDIIIIEIKAVEFMIPLYSAQLLSYLKLCSKPKGLLINFNSENIGKNVISMVTEDFRRLPVK